MARNFRRGFVRSSRKPTDWSASLPQAALTAVPAASAVLDQVLIPIVGGETLIRSRGMLSFGSDQQAASEVILGAYGIGVVSAQAVSVGITAIPHPATDAAWGGWLWHTFLQMEIRIGDATGMNPAWLQSIVIDSKAMRKIGEEERLVFVVENTSASTGFEVASSVRLLSKVH